MAILESLECFPFLYISIICPILVEGHRAYDGRASRATLLASIRQDTGPPEQPVLQEKPLHEKLILPQEDPSTPINPFSSLPVDSMILDNSSPVPDELKFHQVFLRRLAVGIKFSLNRRTRRCKFFDLLKTSIPGRLALPINQALPVSSKTLRHSLASFSPYSQVQGDRLYHIPL